MSQKNRFFITAATIISILSTLLIFCHAAPVRASSGYGFVVLSQYTATMKTGDEFYLIALTSTGKKARFSSSDSSVVSVNTYGKVTAKKAGNAKIIAKSTNGEAECRITVEKTTIRLNKTRLSLENGETFQRKATTSTGHPVTFRSSKKSVAVISGDGLITAKKPGTTDITVTADKTSVTCSVTVKQPSVKLNRKSATLYRKGTIKLSVQTSSGSTPVWKTNKKSVATVDNRGTVTAVKNGTAIITVTVDGVSRTCEITVKKPSICFESETVTLAPGAHYQTKVTVSSGTTPVFSSSNSTVASVDADGIIHAKETGRAYIYAKEDGTKERITVFVK